MSVHPARRRAAVLIVLLAAVAFLAGCVRSETDLTVDGRSNTVTGTITITAPLSADTPEARDAVVGVVLALEDRALPGLRSVTGVSAAPYDAEGFYGTELTLDAVRITDLMIGDTQLISREASTYTVTGSIDTTGVEGVPLPAAEGERPPGAAESSIRITITFPGPVTDVAGSAEAATVDGNTVTWQGSWDTPLVLAATASATSASFPPWIWKGLAWGVGGLAVLSLAGLLTVWVRSRND